jgi:hypothetical protein
MPYVGMHLPNHTLYNPGVQYSNNHVSLSTYIGGEQVFSEGPPREGTDVHQWWVRQDRVRQASTIITTVHGTTETMIFVASHRMCEYSQAGIVITEFLGGYLQR